MLQARNGTAAVGHVTPVGIAGVGKSSESPEPRDVDGESWSSFSVGEVMFHMLQNLPAKPIGNWENSLEKMNEQLVCKSPKKLEDVEVLELLPSTSSGDVCFFG